MNSIQRYDTDLSPDADGDIQMNDVPTQEKQQTTVSVEDERMDTDANESNPLDTTDTVPSASHDRPVYNLSDAKSSQEFLASHWIHPSNHTYDIPELMQIVARTKNNSARIQPHDIHIITKRDTKTRLQDQDTWLMLAVTGQLGTMKIRPESNDDQSESKDDSEDSIAEIEDLLLQISTLVFRLGARVDAADEDGWTPVHWLLFHALTMPIGEAVVKGDDVDLSGVTRYSAAVESALMLLLSASERVGYQNPCRLLDDIGASDPMEDEEQSPIAKSNESKSNLLDLKDKAGNTVLHYATFHKRVDLVGLLLRHGASVEMKNSAGKSAYDLVSWPSHSSAPAASAASAPAVVNSPSGATQSHPMVASFDTSIYGHTGHLLARRWGTNEGLLIEECRYKNESKEGAIKRLIFQQKLCNAADAEPYGDASMVKKRVKEWNRAYEAAPNAMCYPLVYRADCFFRSPLQVAPAYEIENLDILKLLLKLPHLFHIQPRSPDHAPLHQAAVSNNIEAVELLVTYGTHVNHRDSATGQTPLAALCMLEPLHMHQNKKSKRGMNSQVRMAQTLIMNGADPLIVDDKGNAPLTNCIYMCNKQLLEYLIEGLSIKQRATFLQSQNRFGCGPMHFALYRSTPWHPVAYDILTLLMKCGAKIDEPKNCAGLTPIQVFTGLNEARIEELTKIMKTKRERIQAIHQETYHRKRLSKIDVIDGDICSGQENWPVCLVSEFEYSKQRDIPTAFQYITNYKTTSQETELFLTSAGPKKSSGSILRFEREPVPLIPFESLEVRMTECKGWGLFASQDIKSGHAIHCFGELISMSDEEDRVGEHLKSNEIWIWSQGRVYDRLRTYDVDLKKYSNIVRFMNHSCAPNMAFWQTNTGRLSAVYAVQSIKAGEEMTINYAAMRPITTAILCQCGEKDCAGQVV